MLVATLLNLANDHESVQLIVSELAMSAIMKVLGDPLAKVQAAVLTWHRRQI